MKRVLVTGATGFIGRPCLPLLSAGDYEVHAASIDAPQKDSTATHWHRIDFLDTGQVADLVKEVRPSHLLHFAWYAVPGKYWTSPENVRWVQVSLSLLQAFALYGGQRAVMAGTCAEYNWNYGYCSESVTPLLPETLYGTCKHALQMVLNAFARQANLSAAWGRIFFLYGPHEHPDRLVPSVISSLLRGEPARCSHGDQIRDFLYVEDVAAAFVALLESEVSGAINIASGTPITLKEVIYSIADRLNRRDLIQLGAVPSPPNEPGLLVADVRRLREEVKWYPKYSLDEGLDQTIEWWKRQ
jgi:nucleoside-diphosphate-sugar epimerase